MEFSRQECWIGWPFLSPGDLLDSGIELRSLALQADSVPSEPYSMREAPYYIHIVEYYSTIKIWNMPFAATWINLENIILSEISQTGKNKYFMISLKCGI